MAKAYFGPEKPDRILFAHRPDSMLNDVWLRKNIIEEEVEEESTDEEGKPITIKSKVWTANEVYLLTDKNLETIEANFDDIFYESGPQPTIEERLEIVEGVIGELMEG